MAREKTMDVGSLLPGDQVRDHTGDRVTVTSVERHNNSGAPLLLIVFGDGSCDCYAAGERIPVLDTVGVATPSIDDYPLGGN